MKRLTTSSKIKFLQQYMRRWHKRWRKKNSDNITGFRIGKKIVNGIATRNYSIIFHVAKKKRAEDLQAKVAIPKSFVIKFPDNKTRIVQTDVVQTGKFRLHGGITGRVRSDYSSGFGSAGLYVKDFQNRMFMVTNYHVVAEDMMDNGQFFYRRPEAQTANDVRVKGPSQNLAGRFEVGRLSHEIDAAFVDMRQLPNPSLNILPDGNKVRGRVSNRPIPISFKGKRVIVYSFHNPDGIEGNISDNSSVLHTDDPGIFFRDVIQISPKITTGGDSGSIVVTTTFAVLAIIIGADDDFSYCVPFFKVDDFKSVDII